MALGRLARAALASAAVVAMSGSALANEPCDGIDLTDGRVSFGTAPSIGTLDTPAGHYCVRGVAEELLAQHGLRTITVAVRAPNTLADRQRANRAAQVVRGQLIAAGIPSQRVSTVVPMTRAGEPTQLQIAYVVNSKKPVVAQLDRIWGVVTYGSDLDNHRPARVGAAFKAGTYIQTKRESGVFLRLADSSMVRIGADSLFRVGPITYSPAAGRNVRVELIRGTAVVTTSKAPGEFNVVTKNAIAGVRGTHFRLATKDDHTRIENLHGAVDLEGQNDHSFLARGQGSQVDYSGFPEPPRPLLSAATIDSPLFGDVARGSDLSWRPVPTASYYQVEFARDADFTVAKRMVPVQINGSPVIPDNLDAGRWFWRVTAVDSDGFVGYPSKVYSINAL